MTFDEIKLNADFDRVLQAFAANARDGLILLIGDLAHRHRKVVISAMDPMTRLVVNIHPDSDEANTDSESESDLRVAIHCQVPEEFLEDVSQHLVNLVVTDSDFSDRLARQIGAMLIDGGCWIILNSPASCNHVIEGFYRVNIGDCLLLVKKSKTLSGVRRGGRRARLSGDY